MERKKDNSLVEKLETEIQEMENSVNDARRYNINIITKKTFKIMGNINNFLIPVYVATAISIGGIKLLGGGLPFYTDQVSVDANVKKYMNSDGKSSISTSYEDFDEDNYVKVVCDWHKNVDGLYEKSEERYSFSDLDEDKLQKVVNGEVSDYDGMLNLKSKNVEVKVQLPMIENLSDDYKTIEACIFSKDKENNVIRDESFWRNFLFTILDILVAGGLGSAGCIIRKYNIKDKIKEANMNYKSLTSENIEELKQKILIKKRNLETLKRQ